MEARKRLALALVIMLSGFLLVPFVALPKESFRWQLFVGAYGGGPALGASPATGAPGSHFLISGFGFKRDATLLLRANGAPIGNVTATSSGDFRVVLTTSAGQGPGRYVITVEESAVAGLGDTADVAALADVIASVSIRVMTDVPVRPAIEGAPQLSLPNVPAAFSPRTWLPVVAR